MKPLILPFQGARPRIHRSAWIAPNATIIGNVEIGPEASVFYGCVLRGDGGSIRIGARSNVQDNCTMHADPTAPTVIGEDVTIGHMALVHGCRVEDECLIGMMATLLSGSRVGSGSLVAAGAVVLEGAEIPPGSLAAGVPAKVRRRLSGNQAHMFGPRAQRYVELSRAQAPAGEALELDDVLVD